MPSKTRNKLRLFAPAGAGRRNRCAVSAPQRKALLSLNHLMRTPIVIILLVLISAVFGAVIGFSLGRYATAVTFEIMAIQEETNRVRVDLKLAYLLKNNQIDELQYYYDIAIGCAPYGLGYFLESTDDPDLVRSIKETSDLAKEYINDYNVNHCQEAQ